MHFLAARLYLFLIRLAASRFVFGQQTVSSEPASLGSLRTTQRSGLIEPGWIFSWWPSTASVADTIQTPRLNQTDPFPLALPQPSGV